jgi:hypothetical protein
MFSNEDREDKYPNPGGWASAILPFHDHDENIAEPVLQLDT